MPIGTTIVKSNANEKSHDMILVAQEPFTTLAGGKAEFVDHVHLQRQ